MQPNQALADGQAQASAAAGATDQALDLLQRAHTTAPAAARPLIERAKLENQLGRPAQAFDSLMQLERAAPQALPLAAGLTAAEAREVTGLPFTGVPTTINE